MSQLGEPEVQLVGPAVHLAEPTVDLGELASQEFDELLVLGRGHGPCLSQVPALFKCVQLWTVARHEKTREFRPAALSSPRPTGASAAGRSTFPRFLRSGNTAILDFSPLAAGGLVAAGVVRVDAWALADDFFGGARAMPPTVGAVERAGGPIVIGPRPYGRGILDGAGGGARGGLEQRRVASVKRGLTAGHSRGLCLGIDEAET